VTEPAAFYCVSDRRYFLGAVGLINSLRLVGHREPIYLLDCGLTDAQRRLLEGHVTLLGDQSGTPPWLLKTIAPLAHPAEVMVLIDADMIVTRPLDELIERVGEGDVLAFRTAYERFYPEWGELLDLGELRPGPYVCSGLVLCGGAAGERVLRLVEDRREVVEAIAFDDPDPARRGIFFGLDQDVFNAVLASPTEPARSVALDYRLAPTPPFEGLRIVSPADSRCAYGDGSEPYAVHHHGPKPWLGPVPSSVYSRLLARHLLGDGLAIRVPRGAVPRRLRPGLAGSLARAPVDARDRLGLLLRNRLPRGVMERVDAARTRRMGTGS
jgi:hypothetical protein